MSDTTDHDHPTPHGQPGHADHGRGDDGHGDHGHGAPVGPPGWFDKPENTRRFLGAFYALCAVSLFAELFLHRHVELDLEGRFGFYAVYGFLGIVLLVLISIQLRKVVMRSEDYYDR